MVERGIQMEIDEKMMRNVAKQLGLNSDSRKAAEKMKQLEKKSDDELVQELLHMQKKLEAANIPYEKQMAALEGLAPLMNGQQKARLEKIIGLLKR